MKSKDRAQHDAKMRAMREAGKVSANEPRSVPRPGGLTGAAHPSPPADDLPWRDAAYFDAEWESDYSSLRDLVAEENDLWDDDSDELDPDEVAALDADDVAASATMDNYLDFLRDRLNRTLMFQAAAGGLSKAQLRQELARFDGQTADEVADRMAAYVVRELRKEVGLP